MIASHEEGNLEMCCLRRRTLKLLNMLFLSFSPSGILQKETARCYPQWPCGYECFQWTALNLNKFWVNTVILPWVRVYSEGFFPIGFALHKLYSTSFTPAKNIYTLKNVSSPTSLSDFKLLKKIYYVYLNVILLSFLSKSEVQTTNNSHFPGFVSSETPEPNSFSKFWDKFVTGVFLSFFLSFFFFPPHCFQNSLLLSSYIRDSVYLKTVWRCCFVSPLPLTWLGSIFQPKDHWLKYYRENW